MPNRTANDDNRNTLQQEHDITETWTKYNANLYQTDRTITKIAVGYQIDPFRSKFIAPVS